MTIFSIYKTISYSSLLGNTSSTGQSNTKNTPTFHQNYRCHHTGEDKQNTKNVITKLDFCHNICKTMYSQIGVHVMPLPQNTIKTLQNMQIKPVKWVIREDPDNTFWLQATYLQEALAEETDHLLQNPPVDYFSITTARGKQKTYKTVSSAMADIKRVQTQALIKIYFEGK